MQILNVVYGGGIEQHLPDVVGHEDHRHTPGTFADHEVDLETGSLAARAAGAERAPVKSHHHQGVREIGDGLVVTGRAPTTTRSRPSKILPAPSSWACSGTPKKTRRASS